LNEVKSPIPGYDLSAGACVYASIYVDIEPPDITPVGLSGIDYYVVPHTTDVVVADCMF